jgi:hypothetical protein
VGAPKKPTEAIIEYPKVAPVTQTGAQSLLHPAPDGEMEMALTVESMAQN